MEGDLGEQLLGLLVVNSRVDDDIVSLVPVDGSGNLVLITKLQGVDDTVRRYLSIAMICEGGVIYSPNDLVEVPSSGSRVSEGKPDGFLGVNYEDRSDLE